MRIHSVLCARAACFALVLCVTFGANAGQGATLEVPAQFSSIQSALDAALSGDTVLLAPGLYAENIEFSAAVTLASWFLTTGDPSYVASTVIDGGGGARVVFVPPNAEPDTSIVGLTIQNGSDGIRANAHFTLANSVIRATNDGIDFKAGGGGTLRDSVFEDNTDDGIDLDHDNDLLIENCAIRNNDDDGIEIRFQNWTGSLLKILIRNNAIHGNGEDGVQIIDYNNATVSNRFVEISGNAIYANANAGVGMMGGAVSRENFEAADVEEPIHIFGNTFSANDHGISGGDLTAVVNNVFVGHTSVAVKGVDGLSSVAYNLFFANAQDVSGSNVDASTTQSADPHLAADLVPLAGSPAIDAGTAQFSLQGVPVLDLGPSAYSGLAPDLGAFEFQSMPIDPPAVPILVDPSGGAIDVGLTPTLTWTGEAEIFEIQLAADSEFGSPIQTVIEPGSATSHRVGPGVLVNLTEYHWRVRGSNPGGTSDWSAAGSFRTEPLALPPDPPIQSAPSDGALDVAPEPTLSWAGTAESFEVEVDDDPSFASPQFSASVAGSAITLPPGALSHETPYFWRVAGTNLFGTGSWSNVASFTTREAPDTTPPSVPQNLISPFQTTESIELAWDASTDDQRVTDYNIFIGGERVASETEPDHVAVNLEPGSLYVFEVSALDAAGNESARSNAAAIWTVGLSPPAPFQAQVSSANDDAEETPSGNIRLESSDLELAMDRGSPHLVGMRFASVPLPPGAIVTAARLRFTTNEATTGPVSLTVHGEASDDAQPFFQQQGNLASRPTTSVTVPWDPAPWPIVGESGPDQATPDLSAIVQEIIDRPGWSEGAAMALFVSGSGTRTAYAYNSAPALAPILEGEYVVEGVPTDSQGPTSPTNLASPSQTLHSITLRWDSSTDDVGVAGYEIHRDGALEGTAAGTSYVSAGLAPNTEYAFEVFAFDHSGNLSASSGELSLSTRSAPPTPPANLASSAQTPHSITLGWDASTDDVGVAGYAVRRDGVLDGVTDGTSYVVSGLSSDTLYTFDVFAFDDAGKFSTSSGLLSQSTAPSPPSAPTLLASPSQTPHSIVLGWAASTDDKGVVGYEIHRDGALDGSAVGTSYVSSGLTSDTEYAFEVFALDAAGNYSASSGVLGQWTASSPPTIPTNLGSPTQTPHSITLGWTAATDDVGVAGYEVYRDGAPDGSGVGTSYVSSGLTSDTEYAFEVFAFDAAGNYSASSGAHSLSTAPSPPTPPANLGSPSQTTNSIALAWEASTDDVGVVGYEVRRDGALAGSVFGTSYVSSGLSPGTEYAFEVFAFDTAGNYSASSGALRQSTIFLPPVTLAIAVASGLDDAEERISSGSVNAHSTDLELAEDRGRPQIMGMRFTGVAIPAGATILSATIQFRADEVSTGPAFVEVRAEAADSAAAFAITNGNLSSRQTTTAFTAWNPPEWTSIGEVGPGQRTPDLAAVLQELVDRPGWSSGNAIAFLVTGSGARVAESADGTLAPVLTLEYQAH